MRKKMPNWPTLPRNFSATAGDKNSREVPKLLLRHALSGNIHLGGIGNGRENFVSIIFILSHFSEFQCIFIANFLHPQILIFF